MEKIIRDAYSLEKSFEDFEIFAKDEEIIEELPFLAVYKDYKDEIESFSLKYPHISNYAISCALNSDLREKSEILKRFNYFLCKKGIYLKNKYIGMFPEIEYFADGAMVGGRFAQGLTKES